MSLSGVMEGLDALETLARKVRERIVACEQTPEHHKVDIGVYLDQVEMGARQLEAELVTETEGEA